LGKYSTTVWTLFSVLEDSSFPLLMRKGIIALTAQTLGQHVWMRFWYGKLLALFWKGSYSWPSGCSVKPSGHPSVFGGLWTRLSIFIITFCSSIRLRQNWCCCKANKKWYNLNIRLANRNVRTAQRLNGKIKRLDALHNLKSFGIPF
jgi:hypothetical protein